MVELREQAGFVDEAAHAEVEGFAVALRQGDDCSVLLPCRERCGQVFLDGDDAFEGVVPGFIDDAEAALAYDAGDFEFCEAAAYGEEAGFVGFRWLGL